MLLGNKSQEKNVVKKLVDLDKKAQDLEGRLKKIRIGIHNLLWELVEIRKQKDKKDSPRS